jgi:gamma-glutamyl:cysteine ligase YbdK (ATP-grasp superfamily)
VTGRRRPVADALAALLEGCRPFAAGLGCSEELAMAAELAADPGDTRQRRFVARHGLAALPARLSAEFAPARPAVVAA